MSRIRWVPILVTLSITMSLLFGGWELYRNFGLVAPLEDQLQAHESVQEFETVVNGRSRAVKITLKQVDDLQGTYEGLEQTVHESMGEYVNIQVQDTRDKNENLQDIFRSIQPTLYAGIAKGDYPEMIAAAEASAEAAGVTGQISMNDKYVFVTLEKGDHYLYEILPYRPGTVEAALKGVSTL